MRRLPDDSAAAFRKSEITTVDHKWRERPRRCYRCPQPEIRGGEIVGGGSRRLEVIDRLSRLATIDDFRCDSIKRDVDSAAQRIDLRRADCRCERWISFCDELHRALCLVLPGELNRNANDHYAAP